MEALESVRQNYAKKLKILMGVALAIFGISVISCILAWTSFSSNAFLGVSFLAPFVFFIFLVVIVIIIGIVITRKDADAYKKRYKAYFIEKTLHKYFTDLNYSHDAGMPLDALTSTGMINTGDRYSSNDFTSGQYKDVAFRQADVKIEERHEDSDGNTSYVTIFKGRWLEFEFPKSFNFRLEVVQKWFGAAKIPKGQNGRKFTKYEIESPTFNQRFKIYAEDGFETFYILEPAMIDRIENLSKAHEGKYLFCFTGQKLSVAIHDNKDAFEPPNPLKPIDEAAESAKVESEIKLITDFVDFLRLDHKLFCK